MAKSKLSSVFIVLICVVLGELHLSRGEIVTETQVQKDPLDNEDTESGFDDGGADDEYNSHRDSRLFRFWPGFKKPVENGGDICTPASSASGAIGTCQTKQYCSAKGGTVLDYTSCRGSHTICCQLSASTRCQTEEPCTIKDSSVLLTNVNTGIHQRHYVFPKIKGACQLQLDIINFKLAQPTEQGVCDVDSLTITGSPTVKHFNLCGNISDQKLYLDFGNSDKINVNINIRTPTGAMYGIKPTFIRCDSSKRAPAHCLQYFQTLKGTVRSFNYDAATGMQLSDMDYNVCIKAFDDTSSITWSACSEPNVNSSSFILTGNRTTAVAQTGESCTSDWVSIYGENRHCGTVFNGARSTAKPFLLNVHFDSTEISLVPLPTAPLPNPTPGTCDIPGYVCEFNESNICVCQATGGDFGAFFPLPDMFNTGFCLDYSQSS